MAQIYIVRHSETEWNAQGHIDIALTDRGRRQAAARDIATTIPSKANGRSLSGLTNGVTKGGLGWKTLSAT